MTPCGVSAGGLTAAGAGQGAIVARAIGPILFSNPPDEYVAAVLGARVRTIRQQRGLTQAQLAEQVGVQHPWVSKLERGKLAPTPGRLRALCLVLAVHPAVLLAL